MLAARALASAVTIFALMSSQAYAMESIGPVNPIEEPSMLEEIHKKLRELEANGEMERFKEEFVENTKRSVEEPQPVQNVITTREARSYHIDPTWTAPNTITTPDGKHIVQAGDSINPLDYITWSRKFLFFDARDSRQVELAAQIITAENGAVRAILVAGRPLDLTRAWKRQVYFDQGGSLVRKLGIRQVPALVYQDGKKLRVDEIVP